MVNYTFNWNVSGVSDITGAVIWGTAPIAPTGVTRADYTFGGWSPVVGPIIADTIFTAIWNPLIPNHVSYTFNWNVAGVENVTGMVQPGNTPIAPTDVTREGYTFGGWSPIVGPITVNTTFNAIWNTIYVNYTFNWNVSGVPNVTGTVAWDTAPIAPTGITRAGYTFGGWSPIVGPITVNTTFTATWDTIYVDYTFDWNVTGVPNVSDSIAWGTTPPIPTGVSNPGYTFGGWSPVVGPITANTIFNAIWNPVVPGYVSFTFNWNVTGIENVTGTVNYGNIPPIPTGVTRVGYTFGGWSPVVGPITTNTTFNAIWNPELPVYVSFTFNWNVTGVPNVTGSVQSGTAPIAPTGVTRPGFIFGGWDPVVGPITENETFHAQWNQIYVDYIFDWNYAGATNVTGSVPYNTAPTAPTGVTRVGYIFGGWTPGVGPITATTTFTAIWTQESVSFTFNWNAGVPNVTGTVPYNTAPIAPTGVTRLNYTFGGWSPEVGPITTATTFNAIWNPEAVVTVSYTFNWNAVGVPNVTGFVPTGGTPIAPTGVTRTGYTFGGWSPLVGSITANTTFSAIWTPIYVDYTFNWNYVGEANVSGSVRYNTAPTAPTAPNRANYTFDGWSPVVGAITTDTTFNAIWNPIVVGSVNYTFNWNVVGVPNVTGGPQPIGYEPTAPTGVTRPGYEFGGWLPLVSPITTNTTFDAIWDPIYVDYTFNWNVLGVSDVTGQVRYNTAPTAPTGVTRPGYTFGGWDSIVGPITATETFNAIWNPVYVNYTFNWNTASVTNVTGQVRYNTIPIAPTGVTRQGYIFGGWSPVVGPITIDTTFNAIWNAVQPVFVSYTFNWNVAGVPNVSGTVLVGAAPIAPTGVTRVGYIFGGWSPEVGPIIANTTFNAIWNPIMVSYTFNWNVSGVANVTGTVPYNTAPTAPTSVTRVGYTFGGWSPVVGAITTATTFNAIWNPVVENFVSYTFNWNVAGVTNVTGFVPIGNMPTAPTGVIRPGYIFGGWSPIVGAITVNTTFNAIWNPIMVSYTFNWNVSGVANVTGTVPYNTAPIAPTGVTRLGYTFGGWSPVVGPITATATFNAIWNPIYVSYTFNWNYAGEANVSGSVRYNTAPTAPTEPSRVDYTFGGWSPTVGAITTATTFNAIWNPVDAGTVSYTFNWNVAGVPNVTGGPQPIGYEPTAPTGVTRPGYIFGGWNPPVASIIVNTTFNATWNPIYVGYTFNWNYAGETNVSGSVRYNTAPTAPIAPNRVGYTFGGWSPAVGPITTNTTFNAIWNPVIVGSVSYTFNWNVVGVSNVPGNVAIGGTPTAPTGVIRVGYTFGGWSPVVGPITVNTTFNAIWNAIPPVYVSYTFNWNVAGVPNVTGTVQSGTAPIAPTGVTRPGYTFGNWSPVVGPITAAATFTAVWNPIYVNYTFNWNYVGESNVSGSVRYNTAPTAPTAPSRVDYTFGGWSPVVGAITTDTTFNAIWNPIDVGLVNYTFNWNVVGVPNVPGGPHSIGHEPTPPTGVTRAGYTFGGWSPVVGPITVNTTFNAIWNPIPPVYVSYTFNWNASGVSNVTGTVQSGTTPIAPTGVTRVGYTFGGWSPMVSSITTNTTFNAIWNPIYVSYVFNWNYAGEANVTGSVRYNTAPTAPITVPTRTGYTFGGWLPVIGPITTATTFNAIWNLEEVPYTFFCTVSGTELQVGEVTFGDIPEFLLSLPTHPGFTFGGWSVNPYPITTATTFNTIWNPILPSYVSYTFNWNVAGTANVSGTVQSGTAPVGPTGVTRSGYTFGGWLPVVGPITANTTFNAVWDPIVMVSYTFNWNVSGVSNVTGTVASGTAPTAPTGVTRAGYIFGGWSPIVGPITTTTTFTAIWNPISAGVTFQFRCNVANTTFSSGTIQPGGTPTAPANPTRTGFTFSGWNPAVGPITSNTIFVAQWTLVSQPPTGGGGGGAVPAPTQPTPQPPQQEQPSITDPITPPDVIEEIDPVVEPPVEQFHPRFMIGDDRGNFRPNHSITRAEAATILVRTMEDFGIAPLPVSAGALVRFSDISPNAWYAEYLAIAYTHGMLQGFPGGTFRPNQPITRQEFAAMLSRTGIVSTNGGLHYTDAALVSDWAVDYVYTAFVSGMMHGDASGTFRPLHNITRAEAAATLARALGRGDTTAESIANVTNVFIFPDAADITAWHYFYILEATNSHWFIMDDGVEIWTRVTN